MGSIHYSNTDPSRLSLYIPKMIRDFLGEITSIGGRPEKLSKLDDFIMMLEQEKRKVDVFKRELPFCMRLIQDVIQIMRDEAANYRRLNLQSVGYLQLMNKSDENRDKKTWLSSAQLWKTDDSKNCDAKKNWIAVGDPMNSNGKGKKPLMNLTADCSMFPVIRARNEERVELPVSGLSLVIPGMKIDSVSKIYYGEEGNSSTTAPVSQSNLRIVPAPATAVYRKERRSWSKDLHRRFVSVLQLLGGSNVATPKQIREHMKVDGLTNDEVKSHLQKYRLHKRKSAATAAAGENYRTRMGIGGGGMMMTLEEYTKSKHRSSLSGSPQGPLDLSVGKGDLNVGNGGGSTSVEDEDESCDKKNQVKIIG